MTARKRGLGRGLDALLGTSKPRQEPVSTEVPVEPQAQPETEPGGERLTRLPVEQLQRGRYQPRRDFNQERLEELAQSIRAQGVMQPIVVRALGDDSYEIVAGERRWRAAQLAGLDRVPAIVRDVPDEAAVALALIENIQREDLNPVEEAMALKRLIDEFELTQQAVADAVGKSRTTVTNLLRLLALVPEVRVLLEKGELEMGHGRALLALPPERQAAVARQVAGKGLSVRQTEALVRQETEKPARKAARPAAKDPDTRALEQELSEKVGAPVSVEPGRKGAGRLVIRYASLDELDGILAHIK